MANPPFAGFLTPTQILQAAEKAAADATAAAIAEQQAAAQQQGQTIQGYSQAAAQQVAPIGGQVQAGYQDAAGRTATYSKGFSLGMQLAQQSSANDINKTLAQSGAPAGQMLSPGSGAADVLYGSTGFIPASGLEREGAAFGAAASFLPATMLGQGQQLLGQHMRDAEKERRALEEKRTGLAAQFQRDLDQGQTAKYATHLQARALGLKETTALRDQAEFLTEMLGTVHVVRKGKIVDTGKKATGSDAFRQEQAAIDKTEGAGKEKANAKKAAVKERESELRSVRKDMFATAKEIAKEAKGSGGVFTGPSKPKVNYQQAYDRLWAEWGQDLMRFASGAGRSSLRRRVEKMIRDALRSAGIVQPPRRPPVRPDDRPGPRP